jgi:hypothetical protein
MSEIMFDIPYDSCEAFLTVLKEDYMETRKADYDDLEDTSCEAETALVMDGVTVDGLKSEALIYQEYAWEPFRVSFLQYDAECNPICYELQMEDREEAVRMVKDFPLDLKSSFLMDEKGFVRVC